METGNSGSKIKWVENFIVVDAAYVDHLSLMLSVDFERMLNRRVGAADLAQWLVCVALDGGMRPGNNETQVALVHSGGMKAMENFIPSRFVGEINGMAFKDIAMGEFIINGVDIENVTTTEEAIADIVGEAITHEEVRRIMVVPNAEDDESWDMLRHVLHNDADTTRQTTLFSMQPMAGGNFRQEMLGYSMLQALGIKAEELDEVRQNNQK